MIQIQVQSASFDPGVETNQAYDQDHNAGAVVCFTGFVRDFNQGQNVNGLYLEHFPGMTEKSLEKIAQEAQKRWPLQAIKIIHRVGALELGEPIVFVATRSAHREAAFAACEFIMDYLKTRAPFWKKERTHAGERWVAGNTKDQTQAARWQ